MSLHDMLRKAADGRQDLVKQIPALLDLTERIIEFVFVTMLELEAPTATFERMGLDINFEKDSFFDWFIPRSRDGQVGATVCRAYIAHFFHERVSSRNPLTEQEVSAMFSEFLTQDWAAEAGWIALFRAGLQEALVSVYLESQLSDLI